MGERLSPQYERHHLFFRRTTFTTNLQKAVRSHPGLIVPCHTVNHRLLHLRIKPLDAPSHWMADQIMQAVTEYPYSDQHYSTAIQLAGDLEYTARTEVSPQRAEEASRYAWSLTRQLGYTTMSLLDAEYALTYSREEHHQKGLRKA